MVELSNCKIYDHRSYSSPDYFYFGKKTTLLQKQFTVNKFCRRRGGKREIKVQLFLLGEVQLVVNSTE